MITPFLIALALPSPSPSPSQFDLVCEGTMKSVSVLGEQTEPFASRYRIDLAANAWCEGDCKFKRDIVEVRDEQITLTKEVDTPAEKSSGYVIDRLTGEFSSFTHVKEYPVSVFSTKASCLKRSFSGFPPIEKKF